MNQGDEQHDSRGGQPDPSPVARSQQWKHTNKHQNHRFHHHHHHHQCHCHHPTCCNLPKQQNRNDCDLPIIATHTAPWQTWLDMSSLNQKVLCMKFLEEQLIVVTFHFIKDCFQWWRRCRRLPSQCPLYNHATGGHILKRTGNYWKQFFYRLRNFSTTLCVFKLWKKTWEVFFYLLLCISQTSPYYLPSLNISTLCHTFLKRHCRKPQNNWNQLYFQAPEWR